MAQMIRCEYLIQYHFRENPELIQPIPKSLVARAALLRALMNVRPPAEVSSEYLAVEAAYLRQLIAERGITAVTALDPIEPGIYLWQGDITSLSCDGIVNAANSGLTGCYIPNHACIDNAIHSFAGVQLRNACAQILQEQGQPEPTGQAKLTSGYNLPAKYVLHTVGPIIRGDVSRRDCELLASCYYSCLELAQQHQLQSIAFCCISTGEYRFPPELAAEIAIASVRNFMQGTTSIKRVIFNVFQDRDLAIYQRLLG